MKDDPAPGRAVDDPRSRARADLLWYLRHADALARWPVIDERWARTLEARRRSGDRGLALVRASGDSSPIPFPAPPPDE
jgi:hypothetical protein